MKLLKNAGSECDEAILVGELYVYKKSWESPSFDFTLLDGKSENIHFAVFDIISINDNEILGMYPQGLRGEFFIKLV